MHTHVIIVIVDVRDDGHVCGLDGGDGFIGSVYPQNCQVVYIQNVQLFMSHSHLSKMCLGTIWKRT